MKKETFLHYPPKRDVVFVLGAGTSYPDGVPLQHHILPMILSNKIKEIKNGGGRAVLERVACSTIALAAAQPTFA